MSERYPRIILAFIVIIAFSSVKTSAEPESPKSAVSYLEYTDGGPFDKDPRKLNGKGQRLYRIDINSKVEIEIDNAMLRAALGETKVAGFYSGDIPSLRTRVEELTKAMKNIRKTKALFEEAADKFKLAEEGEISWDRFNQAKRDAIGAINDILTPYDNAVIARLKSADRSESEIESELDRIYDDYIFAEPLTLGYNWQNMNLKIGEEIKSLESRIEKLSSLPRTEIEIRAYHFTSSSSSAPVYLPKYNEVQPCERDKFEKISYELSEGESELYNEYTDLIKETDSTKSLFDALSAALKSDLQRSRPSLVAMIDSLKANYNAIESDFETMKSWAEGDRLSRWFKDLVDSVENNENVVRIRTEVEALADTIADELMALKAFGESALQVEDVRFEAIIDNLLLSFTSFNYDLKLLRALNPATWMNRAQRIESLISSLKRLPQEFQVILEASGGPVADFQNMFSDIERMPEVLTNSTEELRNFLADLMGKGFFIPLADLPVPEGQKKLNISENIDTEFDLQTLCGDRKPGDKILVEYHFYIGANNLNRGWRDEFRMKALGWNNRYFASTGFVNNDVSETWKPTALLSWVIKYEMWDGHNPWYAYFPGILFNNRVLSGVGVSTMLLDFVEDEEIETGIALTHTVFGDWFTWGYGWNLQADDNKGFWFFSIRIFSGSQSKSPEERPGP